VRFYGEDCSEFGIVRQHHCSLPVAARKGEFALGVDAAGELLEQWNGFMRSPWVRLGAKLRLLRPR